MGQESQAAGRGDTASMWRTAWRLLRFAASVDPRTFFVAIATSLAASLAEGVGLVLLLPLLSVAGMSFSGSSTASHLTAGAERLLEWSGTPHWLWLPVVLGIFLAIAGFRSVLRRSQATLVYTATTRAELALSRRVYEAVVKAQWGFLVRQRSGRLTHLLTAELLRVADAISLLLTVINLSGLTLLYLAIALKLSAAMSLLVLALGGALMLLQRRSLARMRAAGEDLYKSVSEVYAATEEHLLNLKSVKTSNTEERDVQVYGRLCDEVARHTVTNATHQAGAAFRFEMGSLVALGAVIFLALSVLHVQAAAMLLLLAIFTRLMPQLASLQNELHQLAAALPAYDHVLGIEAECLLHTEPQAAPNAAAAAPMHLERELRFEDVWFAYQTAEDAGGTGAPLYVLRGIELAVEAGMLSAVVGPSGAGKSTVADLANGLLQPSRGRLIVDGHELTGADLRRWRRQVGYVGQETVLFHQSIRDNLLWAKPDATEGELRESLATASAEFVYELPRGLDSVAGDRGILLSSGQRQRIALARALLRKPALLILDEATNALDVENEARVLDALRAALKERAGELTVLMVAHRPSAIRGADRVFELEAGRVARVCTGEEWQ